MPELAAARRHLDKATDDLEVLQLRILGIQASLPTPRAEAHVFQDLDALDATTELRTAIDCVLRDWIEPAIRSLRDTLAETDSAEEP